MVVGAGASHKSMTLLDDVGIDNSPSVATLSTLASLAERLARL